MSGDETIEIYEQPSFLDGQSVDEIHQRMLAVLPDDIDKSENSIPWDFTRPAAMEKAEFVQFELNETIKLIFPQWAYGSWLDYHAYLRNVTRKVANQSSGFLEVTGVVGTVIPQGFYFATPAGLSPSVLFETVDECILEGEQGIVTVSVEIVAQEGGLLGNVASDTIKLMATPLTGITYVTNVLPLTGGTALESDSDLRVRVLEAIRLGQSYTGCNGDYLRWAKEVSGVGYVIIDPEWDDPTLPEEFHYMDSYGTRRCAGAVRLIVVDENGEPANEQILDNVYLHIMGENINDSSRLAPIGAHLTVMAPSGLAVDVSATLLIDEEEELDVVRTRILNNLSEYWLYVATQAQSSGNGVGEIRIVQVGAVIAKTVGVLDYTDLLVNGSSENITVTQAEYPVHGVVMFSE